MKTNNSNSEHDELMLERKRLREKQRRSDLSVACNELGALISRLGITRGSIGCPAQEEASGYTRIQLIGETIETLRSLEQEILSLKVQQRNENKVEQQPILISQREQGYPAPYARHQPAAVPREGHPSYAYGYHSAHVYEGARPGERYGQQPYPEQQQHCDPYPPPLQRLSSWGQPPPYSMHPHATPPVDPHRPPYGG
jgi:hypothetical protein